MFNEETLDDVSFDDLNRGLDYVRERIKQIEATLSEGEDDPLLDMLYNLANKIVLRMNAIIREHGHPNRELLAQWNRQIDKYEKDFQKYEDILLEKDTLLDTE